MVLELSPRNLLNTEQGHSWPGTEEYMGFCRTKYQTEIDLEPCSNTINEWGNDFYFKGCFLNNFALVLLTHFLEILFYKMRYYCNYHIFKSRGIYMSRIQLKPLFEKNY